MSVATMICNGIPYEISERGREMLSPSGTGTVLIYRIHISRCWREHIPRTGNTSGSLQPSLCSKNKMITNNNVIEMDKIEKWGGSRSGAGRKNKGLDLVHRAFRLRREDADTIKQVSEELGISQADVIHELVDNYRQA